MRMVGDEVVRVETMKVDGSKSSPHRKRSQSRAAAQRRQGGRTKARRTLPACAVREKSLHNSLARAVARR